MKIYIRNVEQVSQFSAVRDESVALLGRDILLRYRNILAQNRYQQLPYMVGGLVLRKTKNEKQDWWAAYNKSARQKHQGKEQQNKQSKG